MAAARMATTGLAVLLAFATGAGTAQQSPTEAKGKSVLTLRVDGELSIDGDGRLTEYRIDTKLDPQIENLVQRAVQTWRFKPILVDGKPVIAKSPMRITLAAIEMEQGYRVKVDNVVFRPLTQEQYAEAEASMKAHPRMSVAGETPEPLVWIKARKLTPPRYPAGMMKSGVEGVVLLNLRLNPNGTVAEVFASQSSLLNVKGSPGLLDRARAMLERNASEVAKSWSFEVSANEPSKLTPRQLTVRVPVEYTLDQPGRSEGALAGKWRHEFRGPNRMAPWLPAEGAARIGVSDLERNEMLTGTSPFALRDDGVIGAML